MWKRRDETKPEGPVVSPSYSQPANEGIPMSTMTSRSIDSDYPRGVATIGKSVAVKGQVSSREDLFVDGEVEGSMEALEHKITVGPHGRVNAGIRAKEILVLGAVVGNIEAVERIEIRKDAKLNGDIKTARIVIEDGAYFKGSVDIIKPEPAKATPAPKPAAQSAAASPQPAPVSSGGGR